MLTPPMLDPDLIPPFAIVEDAIWDLENAVTQVDLYYDFSESETFIYDWRRNMGAE